MMVDRILYYRLHIEGINARGEQEEGAEHRGTLLAE